MRYCFCVIIILFCSSQVNAQLTITGNVVDITKMNYVEGVRVVSTGGMFALTDSLGRYSVLTAEKDSLIFYYRNKPTQKFPVKDIADPAHFDISLKIKVNGKYHLLEEVVIFSKSYKQDSMENRATYADVFEYQKPGLSTSITPGGGVGADVNELINIFRFKRNKHLRSFQRRLEAQEQDKYIDFRFNKLTVKRITGLDGSLLDSFLLWYRPDYLFTRNSNEISFNQYILNASYQFRKLVVVQPAKKADE